jgi:hypothetical protein
MTGRTAGVEVSAVSEPEWATRDDYSPMAWRNRVKAAKLKVDIQRRLGKPSEQWVLDLAAEPLPELPRPVRRRRRPPAA